MNVRFWHLVDVADWELLGCLLGLLDNPSRLRTLTKINRIDEFLPWRYAQKKLSRCRRRTLTLEARTSRWQAEL